MDTAAMQSGIDVVTCPKCNAEMFHYWHSFSTEGGPNLPDCDWDECEECGFKTEPE